MFFLFISFFVLQSYGFNNDGYEAVRARLTEYRQRTSANKDSKYFIFKRVSFEKLTGEKHTQLNYYGKYPSECSSVPGVDSSCSCCV